MFKGVDLYIARSSRKQYIRLTRFKKTVGICSPSRRASPNHFRFRYYSKANRNLHPRSSTKRVTDLGEKLTLWEDDIPAVVLDQV